MQYRRMGKSGLEVSALCLGTMTFGNEADEATSREIFHYCLDQGINFFDTANVYNGGKSEELLGAFAKAHRDEIIIATKAYFPVGSKPNQKGSTRYHLRMAVDASLKRLQTDRIDIFYLHRHDDHTPLEESLRAVEGLVREGKILYPAVSNFAAWQGMKALGLQERLHHSPIFCMQPMYNLIKRQAESEILPMALAEGISVFPYNPLAGGLLSGRYRKHKANKDAKGRLTENDMYKTRYMSPENLSVAEGFMQYAEAKGIDPVALAIAWVRSHPAVTAPLIGARTVEQVKGCLKCLEVEIDPSMREEIGALAPGPAIATDRNEELTESRYDERTATDQPGKQE